MLQAVVGVLLDHLRAPAAQHLDGARAADLGLRRRDGLEDRLVEIGDVARGDRPLGELGALDEAILDIVATAQPEVGRTRAVEILRGGRSKVVEKYSYDGLPHYGAWSHLTGPAVLARVDALLAAGTLRSTGGRFPKLEVS